MPPGIATGFVRKLYRILDHESEAIISWDAPGTSFSIHDSDKLNECILPRYFRGRLCAFRQQLIDHGFDQVECEDTETRECYQHPHFVRRCPDQLSLIVRNPKPKRKAPSNSMRTTPTASSPLPVAPSTVTTVIPPSSSLVVPLKVNLINNTVRLKRSYASNAVAIQSQDAQAAKRLRGLSTAAAATSPVHATTTRSSSPKNPLFSRGNESISMQALLPNSSDLPEPISYLSTSTPTATRSPANANEQRPVPVFSDDLIKSALYFLVSSSMTGVQDDDTKTKQPSEDQDQSLPDLSSLMAHSLAFLSSASSGSGSLSFGVGENPLFSKKKTSNKKVNDDKNEEEEEDGDSLWNLLVASSIDRVKTAMESVPSAHERMQLILQERERLEEQRKKLLIPDLPLMIPAAAPATPQNAESTTAAPNPLFRDPSPMVSDDGLWRLLMSSSIDCLRRSAAEFPLGK